jgi:hypothetical protein
VYDLENLVNVEAIARVGLQRHIKKEPKLGIGTMRDFRLAPQKG